MEIEVGKTLLANHHLRGFGSEPVPPTGSTKITPRKNQEKHVEKNEKGQQRAFSHIISQPLVVVRMRFRIDSVPPITGSHEVMKSLVS